MDIAAGALFISSGSLQMNGGFVNWDNGCTVTIDGPTALNNDTTIGAGNPATTATTGFAQIPVTTGTPTGTPTTIVGGYVPMMADSGGNKLWIYINGAWKFATLT
jgi:hypothetical protein